MFGGTFGVPSNILDSIPSVLSISSKEEKMQIEIQNIDPQNLPEGAAPAPAKAESPVMATNPELEKIVLEPPVPKPSEDEPEAVPAEQPVAKKPIPMPGTAPVADDLPAEEELEGGEEIPEGFFDDDYADDDYVDDDAEETVVLPVGEYEELQQTLVTLTERCEYAEKRYEMLQADWENYRRRTEENLEAEKANASKNMVKAILPALDDFERAITHAKQIGAADEVVSGMYAIYKKQVDILAKEGVEQVRGKGEKFDMNTQQAIERREDSGLEPDTVVEVYQTGYVMNGRVLRPALVSVAV